MRDTFLRDINTRQDSRDSYLVLMYLVKNYLAKRYLVLIYLVEVPFPAKRLPRHADQVQEKIQCEEEQNKISMQTHLQQWSGKQMVQI